MGLGFTNVQMWIPAASLGTSPAIAGDLDTTGVIRRDGEDYIKAGTRSLKAEEEEKTITSQGPEPLVTPHCIFQRDSKKRRGKNEAMKQGIVSDRVVYSIYLVCANTLNFVTCL